MTARLLGLLAALSLTTTVSGQMILIDFETDDVGGVIVNGKKIESPPGTVFGTYFTLTTTGGSLGAAAFDSTPGGPNDPGPDPDLLVDQGNVAIMQSSSNPAMTGDVFDTPNDSAAGGAMLYDFSPAITAGFHVFVDEIDIVDRDVNGRNIITLTDENTLTRTVTVPADFTGEISNGDPGVATVDLSSGAPTESPNIPGLFTTVATDPGFDIDNVISVEITFIGSGALDNFRFILRECLDDDECDDGDLCTQDLCTDNICENPPVDCPRRGTFCDPSSGDCVECLDDIDCDDNNNCTTDACAAGACIFTPVDCPDDGLFCNGDELCDPATGACVSTGSPCSTPVCCEDSDTCVEECCGDDECDDGDACTTDACVEGACQNTPVDCPDDGLFCNGPEACDPQTGSCTSGGDPCPGQICCEASDTCVDECCGDDECDDGDACTTDACVEGACQNTPVDCPDDGLFCNGPEACDPQTGSCTSGGDPCPGQICCEASDTCVDECCGDDECDDGDACTTDACVEGACQNTPVDCPDDGLFCNGPEACDPQTGSCTSGGDPCPGQICCEASDTCVDECCGDDECDDGDACTTDACVEGSCQNTPVDCPDDGLFCNGPEACDPQTGSCTSGGDPCPGQICCEASDTCVDECCGDDECDDGDACTTDACVEGACQNTPTTCPDSGDPCTELSCDPAGGQGNCDIESPRGENDPCDDGDACTTGEVCMGGSCGGGTPVDCSNLDDQCNVGVCNATTGACEAQPANENMPCDDGDACSVGEVCTGGACGGGAPVECPDSGDPCTVLACDPAGAEGNCDSETARGENDPCDDGNACTSGETCSGGTCGGGATTDCSFLDGICTVGVCDPASGSCMSQPGNAGGACDDLNECTENDVCTPDGLCAGTPIEGCEEVPPVPTVGRWGMIIMCLVLVMGLIIRGNRRRIEA